jgi:hypothetical protein
MINFVSESFSTSEGEESPKLKRMPVPTPRTIPLTTSGDDEDIIPEDWKDDGEVIIKRCKPFMDLNEPAALPTPWTETIPEEADEDSFFISDANISDKKLQQVKTVIKSNQFTKEANIEVNVKDIKQFWEVATSPIKLSPLGSPTALPKTSTSLKESWKSMPNLAKDMATQTSVVYDTSEEDDDNDEEEEEEDEAVLDDKYDDSPKTSLLIPIEERKKALEQKFDSPSPTKSGTWKSMPSLNKTPTMTSHHQPLPLVGSCYPSKLDEVKLESIKSIRDAFEAKMSPIPASKHLTISKRTRSSSVESSSSLSSTTSPMASEATSELITFEDHPNLTNNAVYRWDDESNGEIYTDRPMSKSMPILDEQQPDDDTPDFSIGLYVVENGKEYPLVPLSQRKSMFEPNSSVRISYKSVQASPMLTKSPAEIKTVVAKKTSKPTNGLPQDEPVKSSNVPYILEEQAILQNINVVSF